MGASFTDAAQDLFAQCRIQEETRLLKFCENRAQLDDQASGLCLPQDTYGTYDLETKCPGSSSPCAIVNEEPCFGDFLRQGERFPLTRTEAARDETHCVAIRSAHSDPVRSPDDVRSGCQGIRDRYFVPDGRWHQNLAIQLSQQIQPANPAQRDEWSTICNDDRGGR